MRWWLHVCIMHNFTVATCRACHMTESNGSLTVGFCRHKCLLRTAYYSLACNVSELQNISCPVRFNRHGYLCSQCIGGYGFPVYSYSFGCVKCENFKYNWVKYLAVADAAIPDSYFQQHAEPREPVVVRWWLHVCIMQNFTVATCRACHIIIRRRYDTMHFHSFFCARAVGSLLRPCKTFHFEIML